MPNQPVTLDPGIQAFVGHLEAAAAPPISTLSPTDARQVLAKVQEADAGQVLPCCDVADMVIPGDVTVTIFRPRPLDSGSLKPGVLYLHGGGWILGSRRTHEPLMRRLAHLSGATIIYLDYARSPEARFPVALEQSYAALQWFTQHGEDCGIDTSRLAVAGDSAGGNLATVVALLAHERGGSKPVAQVLFYPVTAASMDSASYREFAQGPWLTRASMEWFWDAYMPEMAGRSRWEVSPSLAPAALLASLPPTLILTAEADVLRDEGEAYAARLRAVGVSTRSIRVLGTIHDFAMLNAVAGTPPATHALSIASEFLRDIFRR